MTVGLDDLGGLFQPKGILLLHTWVDLSSKNSSLIEEITENLEFCVYKPVLSNPALTCRKTSCIGEGGSLYAFVEDGQLWIMVACISHQRMKSGQMPLQMGCRVNCWREMVAVTVTEQTASQGQRPAVYLQRQPVHSRILKSAIGQKLCLDVPPLPLLINKACSEPADQTGMFPFPIQLRYQNGLHKASCSVLASDKVSDEQLQDVNSFNSFLKFECGC